MGIAARGMLAVIVAAVAMPAIAHVIGGRDAVYVAGVTGADPVPYLYLGAKHMVTGVDHLAFLAGVVFFLSRFRDVLLYVSLFALGHSLTLIAGVLAGVRVSPYLIDAVIGVSVCYKALENLGLFRLTGVQPDTRLAVFGFGLIHGLGLATRLQSLQPDPGGLVANLIAFNVGVELGQMLALGIILALLLLWRGRRAFRHFALTANVLLFIAGVTLAGNQIAAVVYGGTPS